MQTTLRAAILTLLLFNASLLAAEPVAKGAAEQLSTSPDPRVLMVTTMGNIELQLFAQKAPKSVENFLSYVDEQYYDETIFHRIINGFMIQGGGLSTDMVKKETKPPVENEANNGLNNRTGTIAMARTMEPHSATSQFFINVNNNTQLDFREKRSRAWGYAVFGRVVKGMPVVKKIKEVETGVRSGRRDVPLEPVIIKSIKRIN